MLITQFSKPVYFIVLAAVIVGLIFLIFNTSMFRFTKTIFLIAKVSPYEQVVPGASSILVLGDSTGYGTGVSSAKNSIAGLIGQDYPGYNIKNDSKNGRTIGELVSVAESLEGKYDLVLLQIGANDILQKSNVEVVEKELRKIVSILSKHTENIVMISSGNVGTAARFSGDKASDYDSLTRSFRHMFLKVSENTELTYVDLFLEPKVDVFLKSPDVYFSIDGLHPSDEGYAHWYETLRPVMKDKL